jgi:hypothetical protein
MEHTPLQHQAGARHVDTEHTDLVGAERCLEIVFPHKESRPGLRTFRGWQATGLISYRKIGRRTFFSPAEVRAELDKRFTVHASE